MILYAPFTDEVTSYEEALEKFVDFLRLRDYSPRTIVRYQQDLEKMIRFLRDARNVQSLDDVTKKDLFEYETEVYSSLRIRDKQPLSQDSKVGRIVAMKSFFNFLSLREMIPYNPAEHISIPTVNRHKLRDVYSEEEIINMLESAKGETPLEIRDRAMMELLYSTAIRPDEMIHVATKDLDIEKAELKIRFGKGRMGKRERLVPVGHIALEWLKVYISYVRPIYQARDDDGYLFLSFHGRPLTVQEPNRLVKYYAKKSGLQKKVIAYSLRHACATHMLKRGCDIRFIQELLGHDSIETTVIYTRLVIDDLKEIHDKTHPREQEAIAV